MIKKIVFAGLLLIWLGAASYLAYLNYGNASKGEWACVNDKWEKRGEPKEPMPQSGCPENKTNLPRGKFSNGDGYGIFETEGFSLKYPFWPTFDMSNDPSAQGINLAASNGVCIFVIKISEIPADTTFRARAQNLLDSQIANPNVKMMVKEIDDDRSRMEGEIETGSGIMMNVAYSYLTKNNKSAGFVFTAPNHQFEKACRPVIAEVVESVSIK